MLTFWFILVIRVFKVGRGAVENKKRKGRRGSMRKYRGLSTLKQCGGLPEGGNAYS